jgi:uncharacterized repeat protein (TIGR03803 family)
MKQQLLAVIVLCAAAASPAFAQYSLTTLATFNGANGADPNCTLIADSSGNLYGTTEGGGPGTPTANGTVFEITAGTHVLTTLANFNGSNGNIPVGGLVADSNGNLYGATESGAGNRAAGSVFKIAANSHALTTVAAFGSYGVGFPGPLAPLSALIVDSAGDLFGTTSEGGSANGSGGGGTIFEVAAGSNVATVLYSFTGGADGASPQGRLLADASGNLYGTTLGSSTPNPNNQGTVFKLSRNINPQVPPVLFNLATLNGSNGADPHAGLIADAHGNLYGTTSEGGTNGTGTDNAGTVFEIAADTGVLTILHSFTGLDGSDPTGDLLIDSQGNLFGTTSGGGAGGGGGTVFEIAAGTDALTTLYSFSGGAGGEWPAAGLTMDANGNLYGTTSVANYDGAGSFGTVFELSPTPEPASLGLLALSSLALLRRARIVGGRRR